MRPKLARRLIEVAIELLIISQIGSWLYGLFGTIPALVAAAFVGIVQFVCSRRAAANVKHYFYILVPTILFTVLPSSVRIYNYINGKSEPLLVRIWDVSPVLISFVIPVVLLTVAWFCLGGLDESEDV